MKRLLIFLVFLSALVCKAQWAAVPVVFPAKSATSSGGVSFTVTPQSYLYTDGFYLYGNNPIQFICNGSLTNYLYPGTYSLSSSGYSGTFAVPITNTLQNVISLLGTNIFYPTPLPFSSTAFITSNNIASVNQSQIYPSIPQSYKQIILNDQPIFATFFDTWNSVYDASGNGSSILIPANLTVGQAGAVTNSGMFSALINQATIAFANTNTLSQALCQTNSFAIEAVFIATNPASGGAQYPLLAKDNTSLSFEGVAVQVSYGFAHNTRNNAAFPTTWFGLYTYIYDGVNTLNFVCGGNITNGELCDVIDVYSPSNNWSPVNVWLNGNSCQQTEAAWPSGTLPTTPQANTQLPIAADLFSWPGNSGTFIGKLQMIAVYTNLTLNQIKTHYQALCGNTYSPNNYWYNSTQLFDTNGNQFCAPNPYFIYDTNDASAGRWFMFYTGFDGTNFNPHTSGYSWDLNSVQTIKSRWNTQLTVNGWSSPSCALNASNNIPMVYVARPSVIWNPMFNYWVMAGRWITNEYYPNAGNSGGQFAFFATNYNLSGQFTLVSSNITIGGDNPGDCALFSYGTPGNYTNAAFVFGGGSIYAIATTTNFYTTSGSLYTVYNGGDGNLEGVGAFCRSNAVFVVGSPQEDYDAFSCTNIFVFSMTNSPLTSAWYGDNNPPSLFSSGQNPWGTGLEGQSGAGCFLDPFSGQWHMMVDYWHDGDLFNSSISMYTLNFTSSTNMTASYSPQLIP